MSPSILIDIEELRVGMFVQLEMGWMNHPFPTSSFRVSSTEQIQALRELGLRQVRWVPSKSVVVQPDLAGESGDQTIADTLAAVASDMAPLGQDIHLDVAAPEYESRRTYQALQARARGRFQQAAALYAEVCTTVNDAPVSARTRVEDLVRLDVAEFMEAENYAVQLLAQVAGQRQTKHSVNVMVLSMMLGRALGLPVVQLERLAVAGLLHDIGKIDLPVHVAEPGAPLSAADRRLYEEHVLRSVVLGQRMGLDGEVLLAIGQHHEMADGSGFPQHTRLAQINRHGQIVALVNRYDRLCNPLHGEPAYTPHEALARLFAQERKRFDATTVLPAFIRLMGVYPPGSLVQLSDGRFARVVSSNSQFPLRPYVMPFVRGVAPRDARVIDLGAVQGHGIRRSVRMDALPDDALEFFVPEQLCYFFERVPPAVDSEDGAP